MKSNTKIVKKMGAAFMIFAIVAGSSAVWSAENEHGHEGSRRGPDNRPMEQRDRQGHVRDQGDQNGRKGPPAMVRGRGRDADQSRGLTQRPSVDQSRKNGKGLHQGRGFQQFGENKAPQGRRGFRPRSLQTQRPEISNFPQLQRSGSPFQDRGHFGINPFRGPRMSRGGFEGLQNRRLARAFAMRRMAQIHRGASGRPFMRGEMSRDQRGPDRVRGKAHFQPRDEKAKGQGRHLKFGKGKGPQKPGLKNRGPNKDRSSKNYKGIRSHQGGKKGDKGKRNGSKRNRSKRS